MINNEEEVKKIVKLMEEGCKDYLIKGQRLVKETGERDFRRECDLQIFLDKDGNFKFGRRI